MRMLGAPRPIFLMKAVEFTPLGPYPAGVGSVLRPVRLDVPFCMMPPARTLLPPPLPRRSARSELFLSPPV